MAEDLLLITAVHLMREQAVRALLQTAGAHRYGVERLMSGQRLKRTAYQGRKYYIRSMSEQQA